MNRLNRKIAFDSMLIAMKAADEVTMNRHARVVPAQS